MHLHSTIRNFVVENFLFGDDSQLEDDTSFLEAGVIDSTGILELVSFIEETYNIHVGDEELVPENLDSLNNVVQYVQQKLNLRASVAP